jgi:hypothetical protein
MLENEVKNMIKGQNASKELLRFESDAKNQLYLADNKLN